MMDVSNTEYGNAITMINTDNTIIENGNDGDVHEIIVPKALRFFSSKIHRKKALLMLLPDADSINPTDKIRQQAIIKPQGSVQTASPHAALLAYHSPSCLLFYTNKEPLIQKYAIKGYSFHSENRGHFKVCRQQDGILSIAVCSDPDEENVYLGSIDTRDVVQVFRVNAKDLSSVKVLTLECSSIGNEPLSTGVPSSPGHFIWQDMMRDEEYVNLCHEEPRFWFLIISSAGKAVVCHMKLLLKSVEALGYTDADGCTKISLASISSGKIMLPSESGISGGSILDGAVSPDGSAVCVAQSDGAITFYQLDLAAANLESPRTLKRFNAFECGNTNAQIAAIKKVQFLNQSGMWTHCVIVSEDMRVLLIDCDEWITVCEVELADIVTEDDVDDGTSVLDDVIIHMDDARRLLFLSVSKSFYIIEISCTESNPSFTSITRLLHQHAIIDFTLIKLIHAQAIPRNKYEKDVQSLFDSLKSSAATSSAPVNGQSSLERGHSPASTTSTASSPSPVSSKVNSGTDCTEIGVHMFEVFVMSHRALNVISGVYSPEVEQSNSTAQPIHNIRCHIVSDDPTVSVPSNRGKTQPQGEAADNDDEDESDTTESCSDPSDDDDEDVVIEQEREVTGTSGAVENYVFEIPLNNTEGDNEEDGYEEEETTTPANTSQLPEVNNVLVDLMGTVCGDGGVGVTPLTPTSSATTKSITNTAVANITTGAESTSWPTVMPDLVDLGLSPVIEPPTSQVQGRVDGQTDFPPPPQLEATASLTGAHTPTVPFPNATNITPTAPNVGVSQPYTIVDLSRLTEQVNGIQTILLDVLGKVDRTDAGYSNMNSCLEDMKAKIAKVGRQVDETKSLTGQINKKKAPQPNKEIQNEIKGCRKDVAKATSIVNACNAQNAELRELVSRNAIHSQEQIAEVNQKVLNVHDGTTHLVNQVSELHGVIQKQWASEASGIKAERQQVANKIKATVDQVTDRFEKCLAKYNELVSKELTTSGNTPGGRDIAVVEEVKAYLNGYNKCVMAGIADLVKEHRNSIARLNDTWKEEFVKLEQQVKTTNEKSHEQLTQLMAKMSRDVVQEVVRSTAPTPASMVMPAAGQHVIDKQQIRLSIQDTIQSAGNAGKGLEIGLQAGDIDILVFACELVDAHAESIDSDIDSVVAKLQPHILLSLLQQLGRDIHIHTPLKYKYLEAAVCASSSRSGEKLKHPHAATVLTQVHEHLQRFLQTYPQHKMARKVHFLALAVKSLN